MLRSSQESLTVLCQADFEAVSSHFHEQRTEVKEIGVIREFSKSPTCPNNFIDGSRCSSIVYQCFYQMYIHNWPRSSWDNQGGWGMGAIGVWDCETVKCWTLVKGSASINCHSHTSFVDIRYIGLFIRQAFSIELRYGDRKCGQNIVNKAW